MKPEIVKIKQNNALIKLSVMAGQTIDNVANKIMNCLIKENLILDDANECGMMLEDLLKVNDVELQVFGTYCFHKCKDELLSVLKGIRIWGIDGGCENCGAEMRYNDITEHNECINDVCGCSINIDNSPDPDEYR